MPSTPLQLMALGRPFKLGMLYDIRNDQLIPGVTLWDRKILEENIHSENNIRRTSYKISTEDTFEEKSAMLGINAELRLSVLIGLVNVSGSAEYINDRRKTKLTKRVTLQYSTTTRFDQLTMTHLGRGNTNHPEIFNQQIATHVVTGIVYGAEAFFLFDRTFSNTKNRREIRGSIKAALRKILRVGVSTDVKVEFSNEEKEVIDKLTCTFYGDFHLQSNPSTFKEAMKFYRELPLLLGPDDGKAVAKEVYLYPLHLLDNSAAKLIRQIRSDLINDSVQLIETLHQFQIRANDLKNNLSSKNLLEKVQQQLSTFCEHISRFENRIKGRLNDILPKIRSGTMEEKRLSELFEKVNTSPFRSKNLQDWLQKKTQEIEIMKGFANVLIPNREKNVINLSENAPNCEFHFCLVIHVIDRNDSLLNKMSQYSLRGTYEKKDKNTPVPHWFDQDDILETSYQNIGMFIKFAEANRDNKRCRFVVSEEYSDIFENRKGVSIIFSRQGIRKAFKIPDEPHQVHATILKDQDIQLEWSKPQFGSESIQKYQIYAQKNADDQWDLLLTTPDATEAARISNLDGKYQFKIQGITDYGVTPESNVSNTIGEYSLPMMKKVL